MVTRKTKKEAIIHIFEKQKKFFQSKETLDMKFRLHQLKVLYKIIEKYENDIIEALSLDFKKSKSLGMLLVTRLGEMQLRGKVGVSSDNGTHVTVRFKRPK